MQKRTSADIKSKAIRSSCAQNFIYKPKLDKGANESKVATFDLNSLYYEPGQKSYMREAIAYEVLR